jgi:hypothetical protein
MLGQVLNTPLARFMIGICFAVGILIFRTAGGGIASVSTNGVSRPHAIEKFRLNKFEIKAYDACRSEMSRLVLRDGGDMGYFCGCFAKNGTDDLNDEHKVRAVPFFSRVARSRSMGYASGAEFPPESYRGNTGTAALAAKSIIKAGAACVKDANEWTENQASTRARGR